MANTLEIKKISTASVSAADICRVLDEANIGFVAVDNHCWAEAFPYRPTMEVRMAHNGKQLLINYRVTEECVRAVAPHDDGNVWEDSCCELFLSPVPTAPTTTSSATQQARCSSVSVQSAKVASVLRRACSTRSTAGLRWAAHHSATSPASAHGSSVLLCPLRLITATRSRRSTALR